MPLALNNRSQVVGTASVNGISVAFMWTREGGFERIADHASAFDINARGEVVGRWTPCAGNCPTSGFVWNAVDGFRDLGPNILPLSINNRGDIAGSCPEASYLVPCALRRGVLTMARCEGSCVGAGGEALAINARGDAAGYLDDTGTSTSALPWRRDGSQITLDPGAAVAWDINNRRTMAGINSAGHAAIWTGNRTSSLDSAGTSIATAINERGWVVGSGDGINRAFFWDPEHNRFVFLSDGLAQAHDINERGEVVGWIGGAVREAAIWRVRP